MNFNECYLDSCSSIALAARGGLLKDLITLIDNGKPIHTQDNRGWFPLHEASYHNHVECVQLLSKHDDCDLNWETHEGETALILASRAGNVGVIKVLIAAGADSTLRSKCEMTALHEAVTGNHEECTLELLKTDVDINAKNFTGDSALKISAENGYNKHTRALLERGAELEIADDYDITPIFSAAHKGHIECLKKLIDAAKERDQMSLLDAPATDHATPVYIAAQEGHVECLALLLQSGASANHMTLNPKLLPLTAAIEFLQLECVEQLLPVTDQSLFDTCDTNPLISAVRVMEAIYGVTSCSHRPLLALLRHGVHYFAADGFNEADVMPQCLRYFSWPYNYDRHIPVYLTQAISTNHRRLRLIQTFMPDYTPHSPNSLPPVLPLLCLRTFTDFTRLVQTPRALNHYHSNVIGNIAALESLRLAFDLLNPNPLAIEVLYTMILYGVDVRSCFNICDVSYRDKYSVVSGPTRGGQAVDPGYLHRVLSNVLPLCGFIHLSDNWMNHLEQHQWLTVKELEAECQSLLGLCRRQIAFDLIKKNQLQAVRDLNIPELLQDYVLYEPCIKRMNELSNENPNKCH